MATQTSLVAQKVRLQQWGRADPWTAKAAQKEWC